MNHIREVSLLKSIRKSNFHIILVLKLSKVYVQLFAMVSPTDIDLNNFNADNVNSFKQMQLANVVCLSKRKAFFNQFIFYNLSSYNKFIYKVEKEIEDFRLFAVRQYITNFGL